MRCDVISDTHGHLSPELLRALEGADFIVHAGDICSGSDWRTLCGLAEEVHACLGNNDFSNSYGPFVTKLARFYSEGLRWEICHYRERLDLETCEIAICGHTHRPFVERDRRTGALVMNPGSPTFPRNSDGPTMGRIIVEEGKVIEARIIRLDEE